MTKVDTRTPEEPVNFQYDARDRLVQVKQNQLGVETILGQFDYNHDGDRIRHRYSDRGDVDYYYDDGAVLEERNAADDSLLAYYQYADRLLALVQPQGTQYYHHDALGSTIGLSDHNGNSKKSYHLDPWGNVRWESGTSDNRHIFTGHEHDKNTGLVYFGARYYDPEIGRFITQDTYLGEENTPPSLHRYLYAYSNPTRFTDSTGLAIDPDPLNEQSVEDPDHSDAERPLLTGKEEQKRIEEEEEVIAEKQAKQYRAKIQAETVDYSKSQEELELEATKNPRLARQIEKRNQALKKMPDWWREEHPYAKPIFNYNLEQREWEVVGWYEKAVDRETGEEWIRTWDFGGNSKIEDPKSDANNFFYDIEENAVANRDAGWKLRSRMAARQHDYITQKQREQIGLTPAPVASGTNAQSGKYPKDYKSSSTRDFSAKYNSEREARSLARRKLGKKPVEVEPGKLRSRDGRWQYRGKPEDLHGHSPSDSPHIHLEKLNPKTGEVLENWHLRWK